MATGILQIVPENVYVENCDSILPRVTWYI